MGPRVKTTETRLRPDLRNGLTDSDARETLAKQHLKLVQRLCMRFRHSGIPLEDLAQIGSMGLVKAIDKFDPERGTPFPAFAIPVIVGEIKNYFRDHGWSVKIPRKVQQHKSVVDRAVESLSLRRGRSPTVPEIAEATGLSDEEVYDTFEAGKYARLTSLDAEYDQDGTGNGSSYLEYLGAEDPDLNGLAEKMDLHTTVGCLDDREKTIIQLKFYAGLTQSEIAIRLGISQMHVSRLQRQALHKLKISLQGASD